MPDWESLRHLASLAQAGSIAGAARKLNVEHATVARRIASLEHELGVKLLDRRGRKIELTRAGLELMVSLDRMEIEVEAIERLAAGQRITPTGDVVISAPPALGTAMLANPLVELHRHYPGLSLHVVAETRESALQRREADLAIRLMAPVDQDLRSTKLGEVRFLLYASPAYLAATPEPDWTFIGYDASMDQAPQQMAMLRLAGGRPVAIRANSAELQLSVALEGGGVVMLPEFLVVGRPLTAIGGEILRREAWLVIHADMMGSGPVQTVAEVVGAYLRKRLG